MNTNTRTRFFSALLCLILIFSALPVFSSSTGDGPVYVLVGSDFQEGSHEGSAAAVSSICGAVRDAGFTDIDGFLFAGDYDRNTIGNQSETLNGIKALKSAVGGVFPSVSHTVLVQGNHDAAGTAGLAQSGANDCGDYGVFVIHNDDYMWYNSNEETIRNTADALHDYLSSKEEAAYTKPIFVIAHLPLHYSMRTQVDGDAQYANYIFDELNEAGAMGLNIVYLYGHDHSHGWDNYLGGSAVCLLPGDSIPVAQASRTVFNEETLNFTYMNAGYTGYYSSENGADNTLTMCLFEIDGDSLTVRRFDASGLHSLKSAGTYNPEYDDRGILPSNTAVYASPQSVALSQEVLSRGWYEDDAFGVAAYITGSGIEVDDTPDQTVLSVFGTDAYSSYIAYSVDAVGGNIGKADLALPFDEFGNENVRLYLKEGDAFVRQTPDIRNGRMYIRAALPATVVLAVSVDPYENSSFADLLWRAEAGEGFCKFFNVGKGLYLGCGSNATVDSTGAKLTVGEMTGGYRIALYENTGSKSAGDALHFGTANRCSFGDASPFLFYEYVENDLFRRADGVTDGGVYLIAYGSGQTAYLLTGVHTSDRLETEQRTIPLLNGDEPEGAEFSDLLYVAGGTEGAYTFGHLSSGLYLGCSGNAALTDTPAHFAVSPTAGGFTIALSESIGGKSAGDALHLGSGNRVSYGAATAFRLFEQVAPGRFIERQSIAAGSVYLLAALSGSSLCALTGTVYSSGSSSRIETRVTDVPLTTEEKEAFRNSAFFETLYKAEASEGSFLFKNISTDLYLGCEGNATLSSSPAKFTVTGEAGALTVCLAEAIGGKSAGDALHLGSGNRVSYGTASAVALYEYVANDTFIETDAPQDGQYYLIVFTGGYALNGTVYNPGASSRMETTAVTVTINESERYNVNGVGGVSVNDVTYLLDHIAGVKPMPAGRSADLNRDGIVSIADVSALLDYIARIRQS